MAMHGKVTVSKVGRTYVIESAVNKIRVSPSVVPMFHKEYMQAKS